MTQLPDTQDIMRFLLQTAQESKDFVTTQAPLVFQEIVAWNLWSGIGLVVLASSMIALGAWARKVGTKLALEHRRQGLCSDDDPTILLYLAGLMLPFVAIFPLCIGTIKVVKSTVAPRLVLIDQLSDLGKKN